MKAVALGRVFILASMGIFSVSAAQAAGEESVAVCTKALRAHADVSARPDASEVEVGWFTDTVTWKSPDIECKVKGGKVDYLRVDSRVIIIEGFSGADALAASKQMHQELDLAAKAKFDAFMGVTKRLDEIYIKRLKQPFPDIDAIMEAFQRDLEGVSGEGNPTETVNSERRNSPTPECRNWMASLKLRPDRKNYVSEFEDFHQVLKLTLPWLEMSGISFTEKQRHLVLALFLSGAFKTQAAEAEALGDPLAHERSAYEWGYSVGHPETIRMIRFFSEGVQLGVFGANSLEPLLGKSAQYLDKLQEIVGGNGKTYSVNLDYLEDAFKDVEISKEGAIEGQYGRRTGLRFLDYWKRRNRC